MAVRPLWFFLGNRHASWRAFVPWASREGRRNIVGTFKYYVFLQRKVPHAVGHNALAAMAYSGVFAIFVAMIGSGFALYGQFAPGSLWDGLCGPLLATFGNQGMPLVHHLGMWLLLGFAIHHAYSAWLMDIEEKNGTITSIFSGYKFMEPEDSP